MSMVTINKLVFIKSVILVFTRFCYDDDDDGSLEFLL